MANKLFHGWGLFILCVVAAFIVIMLLATMLLGHSGTHG